MEAIKQYEITALEKESLLKVAVLHKQTMKRHHEILPKFFPQQYNNYEAVKVIRPFFSKPILPFGTINKAFGWRQRGSLRAYVLLTIEKKKANIYDIAVERRYQHAGIGEAMLEFIVEFAQKQNIQELSATVWRGNSASMKLFEKCEFETDVRLYRRGLQCGELDANVESAMRGSKNSG